MSGTSRGSHSQPAPMAGVTFASQILLSPFQRERFEMMALQAPLVGPSATKRRPEENPIASAKRWRESRADAAQLSTATTTSCAESTNPAG